MKNEIEGLDDFTEVYKQYYDKVYKYYVIRLEDCYLAEDLASQLFLKALENFDKYQKREEIKLGCWLFRVAHNLLYDYFRKKSAEKSDLIPEDLELQSDEDLAGKIEQKILLEEINNILKGFEDKDQQIITLKLITGFKFKEISEILEENESTVKTKYFRALKKLQAQAKKLQVLVLCL